MPFLIIFKVLSDAKNCLRPMNRPFKYEQRKYVIMLEINFKY